MAPMPQVQRYIISRDGKGNLQGAVFSIRIMAQSPRCNAMLFVFRKDNDMPSPVLARMQVVG